MKVNSVFKRIWSDPVWSAVIASAAFSGLSGLSLWTLKDRFDWRATYEASILGVLVIAFAISISTIAAIQWLNYSRLLKKGWRHYTKDIFMDVLWRWTYDTRGKINRLVPFCKSCDRQLSFGHATGSHTMTIGYFQCAHCGASFTLPLQTSADFFNKAKYLISRRLVDGSWESKLDT